LKKAFSLIELMIVIVIVGVVYTLAITKLKSIKEDSLKPNLTNLKIYLSSFSKENVADVRIFCFDDCSDCSIYVDGKKVKDIDGFLDSNVEVYRYDHLQGNLRR
jgi:prepilin-type N-terminal cleavage/methylation domain-containing protein